MKSTVGGGVFVLALGSACGGETMPGNAEDDSATSINVSSTGTEMPSTGLETTTGDSATGSDDSSTGDDPPVMCEETDDCVDGEVCAADVCVEHDGECADDGECSGDTYCCAEGCLPAGEEGGYCIPYGEGPKGDSNAECLNDVVIGLFEPDVQCEWLAPPAGDLYPDHINTLTTPLVAQLPYDSGAAGEIVIVTYNGQDGGAAAGWGSDPNYFGVIRVLNGQTCEQMGNIHDDANKLVGASPPAIGDLDGDGVPEIVSQRAVTGTVAFKWNPGTMAYETFWVSSGSGYGSGDSRWDGPAIHDLDDDGFPEVISGGEVFDGTTGAQLNPGQFIPLAMHHVISVVGDLDADGVPEIIGDDVYSWDAAMNRWAYAYDGGPGGAHYAFADFGTPGATPQDFDAANLDGVAEVVTVGASLVRLHTLEGQELLSAPISGGGPPTVGDFDNDGLPEIASAGGTEYRVYDLDCAGAPVGCEADYIRWSQPSQDSSSSVTGSSIFDFEGDGQAEAVYGDECYLRVYEGSSGEVLYSAARTSCTWFENPIVADPDFDDNTEILVGSNTNCSVGCDAVDPIHRGVRCEDDAGCIGGCVNGFCRCSSNAECTEGHECHPPPVGTPDGGNTCRAVHPPDIAISGVRVLRDRLDRWASSRPLWNQHAYSITNIEDDLSIAQSSAWGQNFLDPELNNYRQNRQGDSSAEELPDITGKLDNAACTMDGSDITLTGTVCNRGLKAVAAALPATFYLGDPDDGNVLCVAYTDEPVPVEECREVSCPLQAGVSGEVTMVVNDDGMGGALTVECIETNNTDVVQVADCFPPG